MKILRGVYTVLLWSVVLYSTPAFSHQKVVVITGASQGIGLCIAQQLAQEDYLVYAGVRATSDTTEVEKAIATSAGKIRSIVIDVTDEQSIQQAVATIMHQTGRIDVLINNAARALWGTCETCTLAEQQQVMDVTYFGVVRMLQAVVPIMRAQRSGRIINISSVAGFHARPAIEVYAASKYALEGLSESMAVYLHTWNIKVSLIEPSGTKTNIFYHSPLGSRYIESLDDFCKQSLHVLQGGYDEYQDPREIAELVAETLKENEPLLRYQTNARSQAKARDHFVDPTGMSELKTKIATHQEVLAFLK